jgi:hypothetical protein
MSREGDRIIYSQDIQVASTPVLLPTCCRAVVGKQRFWNCDNRAYCMTAQTNPEANSGYHHGHHRSCCCTVLDYAASMHIE